MYPYNRTGTQSHKKKSQPPSAADRLFLPPSPLLRRGVSLRSSRRQAIPFHSPSTLTTLSFLLRRRLFSYLPNLLQPLSQSRFKSLIRRFVVRAPRQIVRQASHVRNFLLEVVRVFITRPISNIFHQPRNCIS